MRLLELLLSQSSVDDSDDDTLPPLIDDDSDDDAEPVWSCYPCLTHAQACLLTCAKCMLPASERTLVLSS